MARICMAVTILFTGSLLAAQSTLEPNKLEVDQWGPFPKQNDAYYFIVMSIIDDNRMLVGRGGKARFVVEGMQTKKLYDGKRVPINGIFKVTKTVKVGGSTFPVIEPFDPDKKPEKGKP